jgi:hypothetical protein
LESGSDGGALLKAPCGKRVEEIGAPCGRRPNFEKSKMKNPRTGLPGHGFKAQLLR